MPLSTYAAQALLKALFQKAAPSWGALASPPTVYVGLAITPLAIGDSGAGLTAKEAGYTSYARKATVAGDWSTPASGSINNANELAFPQATGGSALCVQAFLSDSSSGGELIAWGLLAPSAIKAFQYETEDAEFVCPGHGFANGTEVRLIKKDGSAALPTGVDEATKYFVISQTSDSFKLSLTSGGSAVSISSDGEGFVGVDGALQVTNNVTPKIAATNLTLAMK
jgi:hypothetical protein